MKFQLACAGVLALTVAGSAAPQPAQAHHSFAMFDLSKEVTISGKVRQFQWTNPHAYIQLMAKDSQGREVEWMYLYARGWRPRTLRAGMDVQVTINPLRNGRPGGVVRDVKTAEGRQIGTNR